MGKRRQFYLILTGGALLAAAAWALVFHQRIPPEQLLSQARLAAADQDLATAKALCRRALSQRPGFAPALLLAGQLAAAEKHWPEALELYSRIPPNARRESLAGHRAAGEILFQLGRATEAESENRDVLAIAPHDTDAHTRLAYLLTLEGRRWESLPHLFEFRFHKSWLPQNFRRQPQRRNNTRVNRRDA